MRLLCLFSISSSLVLDITNNVSKPTSNYVVFIASYIKRGKNDTIESITTATVLGI